MPRGIKTWPVDKPRFEAEWVYSQKVDEDGEWNPDLDVNQVSYHRTKEEAEQAAIRSSKQAPAHTEWIRVAETFYKPGPIIGGEWVTRRAWSGDWDGLQHEPSYDLTAEE